MSETEKKVAEALLAESRKQGFVDDAKRGLMTVDGIADVDSLASAAIAAYRESEEVRGLYESALKMWRVAEIELPNHAETDELQEALARFTGGA